TGTPAKSAIACYLEAVKAAAYECSVSHAAVVARRPDRELRSTEVRRHGATPVHRRRAHSTSPGWLSTADLLSELFLGEIQRPDGGCGLLVDLDDVTAEIATLGDHQRIGLDVAADTAGRRNLHVASGGHVAVVVSQNDGVHRLNDAVDDTLFADDQFAAH